VPNARQTEDAYRLIHWGTPPTHVEKVWTLDRQYAKPVAEIVACSYPAIKQGKRDIYRHDFPKMNGRGPYLLEACEERSRYRTPNGAPDTAALGRLIDLELKPIGGGETFVVLTPFYWICTTEKALDRRTGGPVLLGNRFKPLYAIEQRKGNPYITEHGIIN